MFILISLYIIGMLVAAYLIIWNSDILEEYGLGWTILIILFYPLVSIGMVLCNIVFLIVSGYEYLDNKSKKWIDNLKLKKKLISKKEDYLKKIKIIENMSTDKLLSISKETLIKIVKGGIKINSKGARKAIFLGDIGVGWDSNIERVEVYDKELFVGTYTQEYSVRTFKMITWEDFITKGQASFIEYRRSEGKLPAYAKYDNYHIAEVIRAILIKALEIKYERQD